MINLLQLLSEEKYLGWFRMKTIIATRDSVCMGDDVTAPNMKEIICKDDEMLSQFMEKVSMYIPHVVGRTNWTVTKCRSENEINYKELAKVECIDGISSFNLVVPDASLEELGINSIHCSYRH